MSDPDCAYDWFSRSAEALGDDCDALQVGAQRLTYKQLRQQAEQMAARLIKACDGAVPRRVGLLASRTLDAYVGYLAILRAGATIIPFSPDHPYDRTRDIIAAAGIDLVITDAQGAGAPLGVPELRIDGSKTDLAPPDYPRVDPDDLAYIIFTSGSTGTPKGVPTTHRNLSANLSQVVPYYGVGPGSRVSGNFELTFDGSVKDLFQAWSQGGTLVVPTRNQLLSPVKAINTLQITHWFSVPSLISFAAKLQTLKPNSMPTLRWSMFGGEPVPYEAVRQWHIAAPNSRLEVLYGPTETTVTCTVYQLPPDPVDWHETHNGTAPIGTCYPNMEYVLVDDDGSSSDSGELCLRGPQRFGGYLDPSDNPGRFLDKDLKPIGGFEVAEDYWYRSGDRVARHNGVLVHLGRTDHQVKIRGHRIELGEIEAHLRQQPGVRDAAVLAQPTSNGERELIAAVTGGDCVPDKMYPSLAERLPPYMVPRRITVLDEMPLNTNGKIDRRMLSEQLGPLV